MREARQNYRLSSMNLEELNRMLALMGDRIDELEGRRGTPQFKNDISMESNKITSLGNATEQSDAISLSKAQSTAETAASGVSAEVQANNWYNRKVVDSNGTILHGFDITNI